MYVNPIPMIDAGKTFEMTLSVSFDEVTELEEAKQNAARFLLEQNETTLASWLHCTDIKPVYPKNLGSPNAEMDISVCYPKIVHSDPEKEKNNEKHPDKTRCRPDRDCKDRACSPFCNKYGEWCLKHDEQPT